MGEGFAYFRWHTQNYYVTFCQGYHSGRVCRRYWDELQGRDIAYA